jgi:DNA gyrase subunit A
MSIIIELKRGAQPKKVLNQLYKYTPLQSTFGVQLLALVDGEPRLLSLKRALQIFVDHRQDVITRRSRFELEKALQRAHILEGLLIALANLDAIIDTIRQSPDAEVAKERLIERYKLSERQAQAILDMQLRRLAALERQKIEDEHRQMLERIAYLQDLLANPRKIYTVIQEDLGKMAEEYNDPRRTRILYEATEELSQEDLVSDEAVLVSITQRGYIKRTPAKAFRAQSRGGRGVVGHSTKEEDEVVMLIPARSLDSLLFFSDRGKVYSEKAYQIPDADRTGRGIPIVNILTLEAGETITAAVAVPAFDSTHYCIMTTRSGRIKRLSLSDLASVRPSGLIAISLEGGDQLGWARLTNGENEIILVTEQGQALRFSEDEVRVMGRTAGGVAAIRLAKGDHVTSMEVIEPGGYLVQITSRGVGKRTALSEYPVKGRATGGVATVNKGALEKIGTLVSARVVQDADDLTIISANGVILRTKVKDISLSGRSARGVSVMSLQPGDSVSTMARIADSALRMTDNLDDGSGSQTQP